MLDNHHRLNCCCRYHMTCFNGCFPAKTVACSCFMPSKAGGKLPSQAGALQAKRRTHTSGHFTPASQLGAFQVDNLPFKELLCAFNLGAGAGQDGCRGLGHGLQRSPGRHVHTEHGQRHMAAACMPPIAGPQCSRSSSSAPHNRRECSCSQQQTARTWQCMSVLLGWQHSSCRLVRAAAR